MDNLVTELLANIIALALETTLIVLFIKMYIRQKRIEEKVDFISNRVMEIKSITHNLKTEVSNESKRN